MQLKVMGAGHTPALARAHWR